MVLTLVTLPLASPAQGPLDPSDPGGPMTATPLPPTSPRPLPPYLHRGWYYGLGIGLGSATAGGAGKYYSLDSLSGGGAGPPYSIDLRFGHTLRPDLRLGLAYAGVQSRSGQGGLESTAVVGHVGGELSWHPRGDGPFVRGELGIGILLLTGDMALDTAGRDFTCTGPALSLGGGYLFAWHHLGIAHLAASSDLSWVRYTDAGGLGGRLGWSLAWTARIGVDVW